MGVYLPDYTVSRDAPCLKWLFANLSLRRPGFGPTPVPVECVWMYEVALGLVFWLDTVSVIVSMLRARILFVSMTLYSLSS